MAMLTRRPQSGRTIIRHDPAAKAGIDRSPRLTRREPVHADMPVRCGYQRRPDVLGGEMAGADEAPQPSRRHEERVWLRRLTGASSTFRTSPATAARK